MNATTEAEVQFIADRFIARETTARLTTEGTDIIAGILLSELIGLLTEAYDAGREDGASEGEYTEGDGCYGGEDFPRGDYLSKVETFTTTEADDISMTQADYAATAYHSGPAAGSVAEARLTLCDRLRYRTDI